jgi:hypothetical protein
VHHLPASLPPWPPGRIQRLLPCEKIAAARNELAKNAPGVQGLEPGRLSLSGLCCPGCPWPLARGGPRAAGVPRDADRSDRPSSLSTSGGDRCWRIAHYLQEPKKRMKDKAAHACRALCRARVAEESQRRRGTRIGEHLKLVFSITDRRALSCPSAALWLMEIGKARFMPVSQWRPHRLCWFR